MSEKTIVSHEEFSKRIFAVQSNVMILAAEDETTISLLVPERPVTIGS